MEIRTKASSNRNHRTLKIGFPLAISVILGMIILAIIGQNISELFDNTMVRGLSALATIIVFISVFYKHIWGIIDTPYTAISSLLGIAIGTAIGTFITQNTLPDDFRLRYGDSLSKVFEFFQLDDVFHSWWYVGLFLIMCGSLIKVSWNKGFGKNSWAFHLAHLSPVIVLLGFWIDYFYGFRGIISLEIDQVTNEATLYRDHTNYTRGKAKLPFSVRLDTFESQRYDPDYRLQIWKNNPKEGSVADPHNPQASRAIPEIKASFPLEQKKIRKIYGTEVRFWLLDFYPNFEFDYTYPENTDTIALGNPGILVDLKTIVGEATLQLRQNPEGQNKISDPSMGSSLEFYWNPPDDAFIPLETEEQDTAFAAAHASWATMGRIIFSGYNNMVYYVREGGIKEEKMEFGKFIPFPGKESEGFTIKYLMPDTKYLVGVPASKNDILENPVAKVQFWGDPIDPPQTAYLYPGLINRAGTFSIPQSDYFVALESFKEMETLFWKSELSILDQDDNVIQSKSIKVNEPFHYKGYRLYQSDYDPKNPKYSGIGISYTPGLYTVYFGFILMVIGTVLLFYFRPELSDNELT